MYFEAKETARELSYPGKRGLGDRVHSFNTSSPGTRILHSVTEQPLFYLPTLMFADT